MRMDRPASTPTIMATVFPTSSSLEESIRTPKAAKAVELVLCKWLEKRLNKATTST
jgi:hypothetical protein